MPRFSFALCIGVPVLKKVFFIVFLLFILLMKVNFITTLLMICQNYAALTVAVLIK